MFRPLPLFIGLRYAYSKKSDSFGRFVSWLSMIGIMLGSIGLIVIMSVMNGFENEMQNNILQYIPQAQITADNERISTTEYPKSSLPPLKQVNNMVPLVSGDVILQSAKSIVLTTMLGVDPSKYDPIINNVYWGEFATLQSGQYNIILGRNLASQLNVNVGDKIRLMVPEVSQITPVGKLPSQRVFTVSGLFSVNRDIEQSIVYLNIDDAAKLMRYPDNTITSWRLYLDKPLNIESLVSETLPKSLHFIDWRVKRGELFQAIKMEKNVMGLLISLIVIVAAFNIITSLSLLVMEKQNEIAILKTQGLTRKNIMLIFVIQGASSGIIGTVVGCFIGLMFALNLSDIMSALGLTFSGIRLPSVVDMAQVTVVFIALLLLSIVATLYPAYRAANIQPAEALRYE
ncbi:lipoprotein-releasing system permease protein [Orbus hercynius]|uniref:Lipoprotein-releasing system permease protein n=1 Tax=Orbus hercynius TaxID=593135 RepID=A0A495RK18_9GAMM|nr:lipoprotein-releasing ABC transporter permease subunit LolC [Orbus hercynius]RKS87506.1 lipoprotein-releasing system permease protein [Orbus hercynius]